MSAKVFLDYDQTALDRAYDQPSWAPSSYVKFDDRIEHALSPQRHLERLTAPVIVAYAEHDSPEFQRQSRELAEALQAAGLLRQLIVAPGLNHFEIPETLPGRTACSAGRRWR